jgi:hybrid polyketide synthase/nonribosomal peptide synthetase ACE1
LPAGFPAPNYALYITDAQLNALPLGVPGEILVGGVGVSAGYLGLDAVTREKFVPNPFKDPNFAANGWTTLYRTGDRGRLRDDGALLIDGRIDGDTQVKIRGFRVELAEIENAILEMAKGALKHAVVTTRESAGGKFLAAHVVFSRHHSDAGRIEFLEGLQARLLLPDYMRPAVIIAVEKLPLTAHSKFDRAAVKALQLDGPINSSSGSAGNRELTPIEARLEELWKTVLPVAPTAITPESNFFHVGGSSLLLVKLQRIIKQEFSAAPKLVELMNAGKLSEMAAVTTAALSGRIDWEAETAVPESWKDEFPLSAVRAMRQDGGLNILLTGATGYLGRHLVPALVQSKHVAKLFCIVRRETDVEALNASDKVVIFTGDLGEPSLGLTDEEFAQLASESDVILHSGANRSFWDDYEILRAVNTGSVKELTRLALPRRVPLHFVSSGSVRIYGTTQGASIYNIDQYHLAGDTPPEDGTDGYVASKWASEVFLRKVMAQFNLSVTLHIPMPVPGYGPDDSHAEPEPDHMLHELVEITKRLQVRPTMEGLGGWADIVPAEVVVKDILEAISKKPSKGGRGSKIFHNGVRRINWQRFIAELQDNPELNTLPSKDTLLWIGQAKRSGYSYFMPAHRLIVLSEEGDMVSRR